MSAPKRKQKRRLIKEHGKFCFYCQTPLSDETVTRDHVLPKSLGFTLQANCVPACSDCNVGKGDMIPCRDIIMRFLDSLRTRKHHYQNLPRFYLGFMRDQQLIDAIRYFFGEPNIPGVVRSY